MTVYKNRKRAMGLRPLVRISAVAAGLLLPLAACDVDTLLEVEDPDVATPTSVQDPSALGTVYAGVLGDFAEAYAGSGNTGGGSANEGQILLSGLLGDEFTGTDTFDTRIEIDQRAIRTNTDNTSSNGQLEDAYRNLHRARIAAENGAELMARASETSSARRAEVVALAGFTYIMFGENYCSGVPFSRFPVDGGPAEYGAPTSRDETFRLAIARFDSALAITPAGAAGDAQRNLARVGRGRALLNLGDFAGAAAAVAEVPTTFVYNVPYSDNTVRQYNGVFEYATSTKRYGVSEQEGINGLPYRSAADPRVPFFDNGRPFDTSLPFNHFAQRKYANRGSDIPLATGREARLIQQEAGLNRNNAAAVNALFRERAFEMYATSHRLGDMRRLIRQYGRTEDQVFPTGEYTRAGEQFGDDVNFPIYFDELNNPSFEGCIDRSA